MPRVEGSEQLALSQARVWGLLNDPETLAASIPGCRGFERDGDAEHRYRTAITVAAGAVTGVYEGTVEYLDVDEPERCTIVIAGKGDKGAIDGRGLITLAARGDETEVGYQGDFKLTGPVAGVGQRLAPGISRKLIVETLRNLERHGDTPEAAPQPVPVEGAAEPLPHPPAQTTTAPPSAQAFKPFSVSPLGAFAAGCVLGLVLGLVLGALL